MPVRGRRPSDEGVSNNRHRPVHTWTEVEDTPFTDGPKLPAKRCDGRPWSQRARAKWAAWSTMPHACLWAESDWSFALDGLEVSERFNEGCNALAAELRLRGEILGVTADARRALRIRYVEPRKPKLAEVIEADDYREL